MKQTAGQWDPKGWPLYFLAMNTKLLQYFDPDEGNSLLIAVNELDQSYRKEMFDKYVIGRKRRILLDSGIYWLATQHGERHGISMDQALNLAPDEIDGFQALLENYIGLVRKYEADLWGYIELDQGGRENKKKTRAYLEGLGLRPIPVYHPLNDGWEYFDELASNYDRICVGNIVKADGETRKRIISTIWERRRKYPHLWIHALGMTPNDMTLAYMMNSCDSSSWVMGLKFGRNQSQTVNGEMSRLINGFVYNRAKFEDELVGYAKACNLSLYSCGMLARLLANFKHDMEVGLGANMVLPNVDHG